VNYKRRQLMSKRVYISGPISGYDLAERKEAFASAANRFRRQGYYVVNPMEIQLPKDASWSDYMRADIRALMDCDIIYMLSGWHASRGATIERNLAEELGMKVMLERQ
jgi:hypothetical protein